MDRADLLDKPRLYGPPIYHLDHSGHSAYLQEYADWAIRHFDLCLEFVKAMILHDIGKEYLPRYDWLPRQLTTSEHQILRSHVLLSWRFFITHGFGTTVQDVALYHHERWDGTGYLGLKGKAIPFAARVAAILDAYDAMRSPRPYRDPLAHEQVLDIMQAEAEKAYEPELLTEFIRYIESRQNRHPLANGKVSDQWVGP
jgi:HD-GYP domain-containing protein (c-di-GMP phosphodiesterase class II)